MRLFLLPISTRRVLVYCFRPQETPVSNPSFVQKAINKVPETWAKWQTADSGWKKVVTQYGDRALQRIPYEEWALKSFPPLSESVRAKQLTSNERIEVVYPENVIEKEDVSKILTRLATERKQLHLKRFWGSLFGLPFTVPFGIIPILPNIPFFYLAFRCYSHWRALKGSDFLEMLIDHRLLKPVSTTQMLGIYENMASRPPPRFTFVTRSEIIDGTAPEEKLLLKSGAHSIVAEQLQVPELAVEVERAVQQVGDSIEREAKAEEAEARRAEDDNDKTK